MTADSSSETSEIERMKRLHRENPSAWMELVDNQTLPLVIDALLESPPNREFNKTELGKHAGVSRESIRKHLDILLKFGIMEEVPDTSPTCYRLNDKGIVTKELFELKSALNQAGTSENKNISQEEIDEAEQEFGLSPTFLRDDDGIREIGLVEPS